MSGGVHSGSGASAEAQGSANGQTTEGFRDRDPPPKFAGESPEEFRRWLRDLALWRHETDVIPTKQGTKLFRSLSGPARDAVDELPVETLISERGVEAILEKLKEHY